MRKQLTTEQKKVLLKNVRTYIGCTAREIAEISDLVIADYEAGLDSREILANADEILSTLQDARV